MVVVLLVMEAMVEAMVVMVVPVVAAMDLQVQLQEEELVDAFTIRDLVQVLSLLQVHQGGLVFIGKY
jgi:hypothetical protein